MVTTPTIFADGLMEASVHHGVVHLVLAQVQNDGKPAPCGTLCVPLVQLPAVAQALNTVLRQVEARAREAQAQKPAAEAGQPTSLPGAFTFGDR